MKSQKSDQGLHGVAGLRGKKTAWETVLKGNEKEVRSYEIRRLNLPYRLMIYQKQYALI